MGENRAMSVSSGARAAAAGLVLVGLAVVAVWPFRADVSPASPALLLVVPVVISALVGGRLPALVVAAAAAAALNVAFLPPSGTFKVRSGVDVLALAVFGLVAAVAGTLVARETDRRSSAEVRAAELAALNIELRSVEDRRAELEDEARRIDVLERVDEQRSALLRSVSHDLRTPLATIAAVVSDVLDGDHYDQAARNDLLRLVLDETGRLDRLVANLLDLSRIEAGALRPDRRSVDVGELVDHAAHLLERALTGHRIEIDLPTGLPPIDGDFVQLAQVVINLLENAARHSPAGGRIRVGGAADSTAVRVWIDDEGRGIPPFERARIFEPFRVGEGSTSSGIGLAICRAVVEAHDGRIEATEAPGGGARFQLSLPVRT